METLFDLSLGENFTLYRYASPSYHDPYESESNAFHESSSYNGLDHSYDPSYDYYPPPPFYEEPPPSPYSPGFEDKMLALVDGLNERRQLIHSHSHRLAMLEAQVEEIASTFSRQEKEEEEASQLMTNQSEQNMIIEEGEASKLVTIPIEHKLNYEDIPCNLEHEEIDTLESEELLTTIEVGEEKEELVKENLPFIISNDPLEACLLKMYEGCGFDIKKSTYEVNSLMNSIANLESEEMVIIEEEKRDEKSAFPNNSIESLKDIVLPSARPPIIDFIFKTMDERKQIASYIISFQAILLGDEFVVMREDPLGKIDKRINEDVSFPVFDTFD